MARSGFSLRALLVLLPLAALAGCASYTDLPPGTTRQVCPVNASAVVEKKEVAVPAPAAEPAPPADYLVGPRDVLYVNVSGHPELGSPVTPGGGAQLAGSRVDGKGDIHLPMVGAVAVAGLSTSQIEEKLEAAYARYLNKPWVVVEIAQYHSQPLYLLGQFRNSGTIYMDRPLTLLEGISMGGGLLDTANLRSARLLRGKKTLPIDIYQLLTDGETSQNVWLHPGDTIYVPDDRNQNVYVLGAVKKSGPVPMPNGQLTLSQALASAQVDGVNDNERQVRIIRSYSPTRGALLVVDFEKIMRGQALPFPLMEGDIVYVPRSGIGNWNMAINEILPSLQAISNVLQPFVQIKFLSD
jgi:polysaccharide export outer membrane protein